MEPQRLNDPAGAGTLATGWWTDAVVYQIYPRSFSDSNGDGIGDLPGVIARMPYLQRLGVDAIWLSPFYPSVGADAGYDVSDPCGIDPIFGTLEAFDVMVARAHQAGIRVIVDVVPNHTSSGHRWFEEALAAPSGSPARDRYIFRPGRHGGPPNDWESVFGGSAWSRVPGEDNEWYLHLFDSRQPDLNWRNEEVRVEYENVLRFWLDRGADGFRVDVAHGLIKADGLPDVGGSRTNAVEAGGDVGPMWDQDEVHDIYRRWRAVLEEYGPERILVAEAWPTYDRLSRYIRPDEMHQAFNFRYLTAGWDARKIVETVNASLSTSAEVGATTTWVMSNHDIVRVVTRLGQADPNHWTTGIGPDDDQPDLESGRRRAAAYALLTLALPGSVYIYQGEELGLPDNTVMDHSDRLDPNYHRTNGAVVGRDGCRAPLPWNSNAPGFGFGESPWLPQPASFGPLSVDAQEADPGSFLALYRAAVRVRGELEVGKSPIEQLEASGSMVYLRKANMEVFFNLSDSPVNVEAREDALLLTSAPNALSNGMLSPNSAVWIARTATS